MKNLCYLNVFFSPAYLLVYYNGSGNTIIIMGAVAMMVFCGLLLRQLEMEHFGNNWLLMLFGGLALGFAGKLAWGIYSVLRYIDPEYLEFRMISYLIFTGILLLSVLVMIGGYLKRVLRSMRFKAKGE